MKLRDIYFHCVRCYDVLQELKAFVKIFNKISDTVDREIIIIDLADIPGKSVLGPDEYFIITISYPESLIQTVRELSNIECLKIFALRIMKKLAKHSEYLGFNNSSMDELKGIMHDKSILLDRMECIIDLYESMDLDTDKAIGLDVKLPTSNDFTEFKKIIDDLEFIFTKCPFFQHENENLKFKNVDVGSTWLTFSVVGAGIVGVGSVLLNNIAAFIDKCIVIRSHRKTVEQQKNELENENMERAEKEVIIKYINRTYKKTVDAAVKELEEITNHQITDGDERGRVDQAFERLERLLDKGLQIYSSIDSPKETKALFELLEMKYLEINKQLGLLEDKQEEKSGDVN